MAQLPRRQSDKSIYRLAQLPRRQSDKSSPARVVFLLEELNFGGTQRQTLELARRLDREKFRSDIWLLRSGTGLAPLAQNWQIPVVRLADRPIVGPLSLFNLWRRLHHGKYRPVAAVNRHTQHLGPVPGQNGRTALHYRQHSE